jgi:hypothetical protein
MVRPGPAAQAQVQAGAALGRVTARHRDALATASRVAEGHVGLEDLANVLDLSATVGSPDSLGQNSRRVRSFDANC